MLDAETGLILSLEGETMSLALFSNSRNGPSLTPDRSASVFWFSLKFLFLLFHGCNWVAAGLVVKINATT